VSQSEIPLAGGRTTAGVVRVGDTVRRPRSANSQFVGRLLKHLESNAFDGAPRSLGTDDKGRDVFSYIVGDVPGELANHDDTNLVAAARLIRDYHDATASFASDQGAEIICHNDLSPCNTVFREGRPCALIDFDAAALGCRIDDLGYAVWLWLNIGNSDYSPASQQRRISLFLKAYGAADREVEVIQSMLRRQLRLANEGARLGKPAMRDWAAECRAWTIQHLLLHESEMRLR
jgi:Ser/Thr protein kinase RdoA (MazF antagonist)